MESLTNNSKWSRWRWFVLALVITMIAFMPFWWAISLSFRSPGDALRIGGPAIPYLQYEPTLVNWKEELSTGEARRALANSLIISVCTGILVVILGTPAAYALARFPFYRPTNADITIWFLSQRVMPPIATLIPFFLLFNRMGLSDTLTSRILLNTTFCLPLFVVIMRQAFIDLLVELEEAALTDGAEYLMSFFRVALPLAAPSLVAAVLIVTAFTWNEFMFALRLGESKARVIPVQMASAVGVRGIEFWFVAVRTLIAILPPVVLALLTQRYIVRGLTMGAVKG